MKVSIRENSWLAKLAASRLNAGQVAIVFGSTIHLHNTTREEFLSDRRWVCHELMHVQQYREHGIAGFLSKYLLDWVKHGYYNNRFEVEARENENNHGLIGNIEFK